MTARGAGGKARRFTINGRFLTQPVTGVQRYAREVTRELDRLLVGRNETACLLTPRAPPQPLAFEAIRIEVLGPLDGPLWEQARLPLRCASRLLSLCNTAPAMASRHLVCIHDTNVVTAPESYGRGFRAFYRLLQPLVVKRAATVATVSQDAARKIAALFQIGLRDIVVLPNGHEHAARWNALASRLAGTAGFRPFVLMIGSIARHKNIATILALAGRLDDLGLDIRVVGTPSGPFAGTGGHAHASNVHWMGKLPDDDLAFLLGTATCLVFPSLCEGFGLPVLEAMARGCPVVASCTSSLPEVCGPGALLADPTDGAAWLAHIAALASSRHLRGEQRQRGLEQAKRFRWSDSASGYLDILTRD